MPPLLRSVLDTVLLRSRLALLPVRVRHGVTFHGIAVNRDPDLAHFAGRALPGQARFGIENPHVRNPEVEIILHALLHFGKTFVAGENLDTDEGGGSQDRFSLFAIGDCTNVGNPKAGRLHLNTLFSRCVNAGLLLAVEKKHGHAGLQSCVIPFTHITLQYRAVYIVAIRPIARRKVFADAHHFFSLHEKPKPEAPISGASGFQDTKTVR